MRAFFLYIIFNFFLGAPILAMQSDHELFVQKKIDSCKQLRSFISSNNEKLQQQLVKSQCIEKAIINTQSTHPYHEAAYIRELIREVDKQFSLCNFPKCSNEDNNNELLAQAHVFGLMFYKTPTTAADLAAHYAANKTKDKEVEVACAAIAHMLAQSVEHENNAHDGINAIINNAIGRINNIQENYYDEISVEKLRTTQQHALINSSAFIDSLDKNNASTILSHVIHYFMLFSQKQNKSDMLHFVKNIENETIRYIVTTLIGTYCVPMNISTHKNSVDTRTKITPKRNNFVQLTHYCTSFLILTIFLLILNQINSI